jgi:FAD/FMN-containing dehydrogenase
VRGGGHNPAGHCVLDGGLVIDLSLLRDVEVDSNARTARSEGGSTWADFDSATQVDGLVTPGGVVGSTGVCGLALSGGYANYMQADEPTERVRSAFGSDAYERLQALKRRYDPTNVLHRNQNIPPGAPGVP